MPTATASLGRSGGIEQTLEDVIARAWDRLSAGHEVECPVCAAEMEPQYGQHARAIAGRCRTCGSTLT